MKKPALIIAAVAGYSLLETALVLSLLLPEKQFSYWGSRHGFISLTQFLFIPGLSGLFSFLIHGGYRWKRRMLVIFLAGTAGIPVAFFVVGLPLALLAWAFDKSAALFFVLLPIVIGAVVWALFVAIRKTGQWGVHAEATKWLADRHSDSSGLEIRSRNRAVRCSLWMPSLIVLLILLFLPEIWGVLSHVQQSRAGELSGYKVTIPPTWVIVASYTSRTGTSGASGIAVHGTGWGVQRYLHFGNLRVSSWGVGTREYDEPKRGPLDGEGGVVAQRDFQIGKSKLTCLEYHPSWDRPMRANAGPLVLIECEGSDRLHADFLGEGIHAPAFYGMLASMTPALPSEVR